LSSLKKKQKSRGVESRFPIGEGEGCDRHDECRGVIGGGSEGFRVIVLVRGDVLAVVNGRGGEGAEMRGGLKKRT